MSEFLLAFALALGIVIGWVLCSRTQSNRISAAVTISELARQAASVTASANASANDLARRISDFEQSIGRMVDLVTKLDGQVESLDAGQGAMLSAMLRAGLLDATSVRRPVRQRGEIKSGPEIEEPPPLDRTPTHAR